MRYRVRIERLVLDGAGIAPSDRHRVGASLEAELERLLVAEGLPGWCLAGGAVPGVAAPLIRLGRGGPATVGADVARAVHRALAGNHGSGGGT